MLFRSNAGCDMVLICNDPEKADDVLMQLTAANTQIADSLAQRLEGMRARAMAPESTAFQEKLSTARAAIAALNATL